jgi:hypothetical protein
MTGRKKNYIFRSEMFSLYCHSWIQQREKRGMSFFYCLCNFFHKREKDKRGMSLFTRRIKREIGKIERKKFKKIEILIFF